MSTNILGSTSNTSTTSTTASTISNGRYWGLASGLDVDSIVTALVSNDQSRIDKANQQKQTIEWQQTAYQSIASSMTTFENNYLDIIGSNSILSSKTYAVYNASSDNSAISVIANSSAAAGQHVISVSNSAVAASVTGNQVDASIAGTNAPALTDLNGASFNISVDGVTKNINITSSDTSGTPSDFAGALQSKINAALGIDKVSVTSDASGHIAIAANSQYTSAVISVTSGDTTSGGTDALGLMGMTNGVSNRINTGSSVSSIFGGAVTADSSGNFTATINGVNIAMNTSDSLDTAFSKINSSKAGVTIGYSSNTGKISITSSSTGAAYAVDLSGNNNGNSGFFTALLGGSGTVTKGQDAIFNLDGTKYSRSSNSFTIDGLTYTVNKSIDGSTAPAQTANIGMTNDVSGAVKSMTDFVNAYNTLIMSINTQITAKPDPNYSPLTDAQKSSMKDTDITNWNNKAQTGILFNDDTLGNILDQMRSMIYQPVTTSDGKSISLYQIGITTSADYTQGGTLQIDTDALTQALQNNPSSVQQLFSKASSTYYSIDGGSAQTVRKQQEGIGYRLQDIINDATKTGAYPFVGSLVSIAGTATDTSTNYQLNNQLKQISDNITTYQQNMTDKKNRLYNQFTQLETYMQQMNSQSSMLTSFGSGSGS
jgi:flagellar hook-associated protein 2